MLVRRVVNTVFLICLLLIVFLIYQEGLSLWYMFVIAIVWLGITIYGVCNVDSQYFVKAYCNNSSSMQNEVAITFDDGPDINTLEILKVLKKYNAKATFFCIGKQVDKHPEIAKQIIADGHIIGNHTHSHSKFIDTYGPKKFAEEIHKADASIYKAIGKTPLLFRPPYGVTNPEIAKALKITKHYVIGWNKRSFDTSTSSLEKIYERITVKLKPGDVILLHDTQLHTVDILEQLLVYLEENKFKAIGVDEIFTLKPYKEDI